jgi:isocitrate dehydrogenase
MWVEFLGRCATLATQGSETSLTQGAAMARTHRIAVIAGDGIGTEVMPEGLLVLDAAARKFGIDLQFDHFDFSSWNYFE